MSNDQNGSNLTTPRKATGTFRGRPRSKDFYDKDGKYLFHVAPELAFLLLPLFRASGRKNFFGWLEDLVQEELSSNFDPKRFVGYMSYARTRTIKISGPALETLTRLTTELETTPLQIVENVLGAVLVERKPPQTDEA